MHRERHACRCRLARERLDRERRRDEIGLRIDQSDARRSYDDVGRSRILRQLASQRLSLVAPGALDVGVVEVHNVYGLPSTVYGEPRRSKIGLSRVAL